MRSVSLAAGLLLLGAAACGSATVNQRIDIVPGDRGAQFSVTTFTVTKGSKVRLEVTNDTEQTRDFSVDVYNLYTSIEPNKTANLIFTADRSGTFTVTSKAAAGDATGHLVVPA